MKRSILIALVMLIAGLITVGTVAAQDAEVVYVDYPEVEIKRPGGATILADFGDELAAGDSVITTRFGEAELELADGGSVSIARDTVYQIQKVGAQNESQTVMSVALGAVRFRFNTIAGRSEPSVGSPTAVAGVRGTEFTTYVAADGSTVFVVEEGLVDVSAEGAQVQLVAGQGVEVAAGERPGEPFDAIERAFDFEQYNDERIAVLLENPVRAVQGHTRRLEQFAEQIEILIPLYEDTDRRFKEARVKADELEGDARQKFFEEQVVPLRAKTAEYYRNLRFYALSGLSLRRYVLGRMYLLLSMNYLNQPDSTVYEQFREVYQGALDVYERRIVPALIPSDL